MKTLLMCFVCLTISCQGISQTNQNITSKQMSPIVVPTNIERYNIDYKLLDTNVINGNWDLIDQIDLSLLEVHRSLTATVQVTDPTTGFEIILFHEKRESNLPTENLEK